MELSRRDAAATLDDFCAAVLSLSLSQKTKGGHPQAKGELCVLLGCPAVNRRERT